ncbi:MAG: 2-oxo acid dehydrogenase subunit E2 [Clostridia bacterium]|nr:2-oxo acid dehydrogenase subunit E2 [Clostridia bacterium]
MSFLEKRPRKFGDRRDGHWVKNAPGMNVIMSHIYNKRTDAEVYLDQEIDVTNLLKYIEKKNAEHPEYKTTIFHCVVAATARILNERRLMNRFIQGRRIYERDEIVLGFTAKRRFTDHDEECLMLYKAKGSDNLDFISRKIAGEVKEMRERKKTIGIDDIMDKLAKVPRPILALIVAVVRVLDYFGKNPKFLTDGDINYASVILSNLGSIKCPAVYHHLSNYGTASIVVTIGVIHKALRVNADGSTEVRDVMNVGATLDERMADGFYFARSLKLLQHICDNPELLDKPLEEESGYDYK